MLADSAPSRMLLERVLLALCLSTVCLALDNGLDEKENVEINPLRKLVINPSELLYLNMENNVEVCGVVVFMLSFI